MNTLRLLLTGCLVLFSGGCVVMDASGDSTPGTEVETARAALLKADTDFARMSVARGFSEAFAAYLAEDATYFPMNAQPISGREGIVAHLSGGPPGATLEWKPVKAETSRSGDLGYTWGTYQYKWIDTDGQKKVNHGKYVTVWRKQAGGSWKVVADIGNPSPADTGR